MYKKFVMSLLWIIFSAIRTTRRARRKKRVRRRRRRREKKRERRRGKRRRERKERNRPVQLLMVTHWTPRKLSSQFRQNLINY